MLWLKGAINAQRMASLLLLVFPGAFLKEPPTGEQESIGMQTTGCGEGSPARLLAAYTKSYHSFLVTKRSSFLFRVTFSLTHNTLAGISYSPGDHVTHSRRRRGSGSHGSTSRKAMGSHLALALASLPPPLCGPKYR